MTRTLADLNLNTLSVRPDDEVAGCMLAMQRAGVAAAAVVEDGQLLGILTIEAVVLSDTGALAKTVMRGASARLQTSAPVREAAQVFVHLQADYVAVYQGESFAGLLSALMLITELGRSWDPLTGLSWSDRLREWGVDCLDSGQEIGIVFFDLNDFGKYNKRYGHIVGDKVLRHFADLLKGLIDPVRDVLVRYGGDEFAIGTTRQPAEVEAMLLKIADRQFVVAGMPEEVGFAYGVSGGKRTIEPSRDHVAATLDNLINLASRTCLASKPGSVVKDLVEAEPIPQNWSDYLHQISAVAGKSVVASDAIFLAGTDSDEVLVSGSRVSGGQTEPFVAKATLHGSATEAVERAVSRAQNPGP